MKLPKSIIKKYGITSKAWAVFRGKKHKGGKKHMAKKRHHSRGRGMPSWAKSLIADKIPPIPKLENYSDEIILGGASLVLNVLPMGKAGKYVRLVSKPINNIEMGKIGEKMAAKVPLGNS
jgi:hypothetical protein